MPVGKHFTNAVLIAPTGEVSIPSWQSPQAMHVIGEDNPGVDAEGRAGADPAYRVAQYVDLRHQQIETGVVEVHCKEEGSARNPIAAIIRHTGIMPELSKRPKALRFSALPLLRLEAFSSPHEQA